MSIIVGSVAVEVVPSARGFRQRLAADLHDLRVAVEVSLDDVAARTELDALARDRHAEVKVDVDRSSLDAANASLGSTPGRIGAIVTAAAAVGPALIPVAAALTAVIAGLSVPLVAATAGIGAFAVFAVPAITSVVKASDELAKAQDAVDNALTSAQRKTALAKQAQLMADLSPATLAAAKSLDTFKATYHRFADALAPQVFGVFNAGLRVATAALPLLAGLAKAVAPALTALADTLATALGSPAVKQFFAFLSAQAGPAITTFGKILGNVATGFAGLLQAFAPVGKALLDGLLRLSDAFSRIADSKGFKAFLAYAVANLPLVGKFIGDLVRGVGAILTAFAPFGPVVLKILDALVRGITWVATHAPGAAVAIGLIATALLAIGGPVGIVVAAFIAIGLAFKYVYDRSKPLRDVLGHYLDLARELGQKVLPVLATVARKVGDAIREGIGKISKAIAENRPAIDQLLGQLKIIAQFIITHVVPVLGALLVGAIRFFVTAIVGAITIITWFETALHAIITAFKNVVAAVRSAISAIIAVVRGVAVVASIIGRAFSSAYTAASSAIGRVVAIAASLPGRVRSAVGNLGGVLISAGRAVIDGLISGITSRIGALTSKLSGLAGLIAAHKGPIDKDRVLLVPHGKAIMAGLIDGITSQVPALTSRLQSVTAGIAVAPGTPGAVATRAARPTLRYGTAPAGLTVNVNGALDPTAVAAQIQTLLLKRKQISGQALGLA